MSGPSELICNGILIVGQSQDSLDTSGFFDYRKAFSGKVSQVQMWKSALTPYEIKNLATCQTENVQSNQEIVQWNNLDSWEISNANTTDLKLEALCTKSLLLDRMLWLKHISYDQMFEICNKVEGKLPIINSINDNNSIQNMTNNVLEMLKATKESNHYLDKCIIQGSTEKPIFWLAQNKINRSSWINPYDKSELKDFKTDLIEGDECAYIIGQNVKSSNCRSWYSCAQCEIPTKTVIYLKGLCPLDIEW